MNAAHPEQWRGSDPVGKARSGHVLKDGITNMHTEGGYLNSVLLKLAIRTAGHLMSQIANMIFVYRVMGIIDA